MPIKVIKTIEYKGESFTLELTAHVNATGGVTGTPVSYLFHVMINRYYQGRIHDVKGRWVALDEFTKSDKHPFTIDQRFIDRMGELIEEQYPELK